MNRASYCRGCPDRLRCSTAHYAKQPINCAQVKIDNPPRTRLDRRRSLQSAVQALLEHWDRVGSVGAEQVARLRAALDRWMVR